MEKSVKITLIIVVGIIIMALLGYLALTRMNPVTQGNTVSADGQAVIKAVPDLVSIYFNVETTAQTSSEANKKNSDIVDKLSSSLKDQGLADKDIETVSFNIYPEYNWNNGIQTFKDYKARHQIKVKISTDETDKIGKIIDSGVDAGAGISYINFELTQEKQNEYKAQALKAAAEDASIKAQSIAEGFNKKLGKLVSVSNNNFYYSPWKLYSGNGVVSDAAAAKEATTNIQPGEQDISASVTAVFKLG